MLYEHDGRKRRIYEVETPITLESTDSFVPKHSYFAFSPILSLIIASPALISNFGMRQTSEIGRIGNVWKCTAKVPFLFKVPSTPYKTSARPHDEVIQLISLGHPDWPSVTAFSFSYLLAEI
jgi:hypothetical protein